MSAPINKRRSTLTQMRLVSIAGLTVSLFTLGLIALMRIGVYSLGQTVKEQITFSVDIPEPMATQTQITALEDKLAKLPGVMNLSYINADSAASVVAHQIGQTREEMLGLLGYNPFSPMFQFQVHASSLAPDSLQRLEAQVAELGLSTKLSYQGDLLESVEYNRQRLEWIFWALLAIQLIFTFIQLNNTTRLGIYADRLKIRTLSLVGASSWFIRRPIVGRSLLDGLVSAILAIVVLGIFVVGLERWFDLPIAQSLDLKLLVLAAVGLSLVSMLSCSITALRASRKYIRMDGNKIHLI